MDDYEFLELKIASEKIQFWQLSFIIWIIWRRRNSMSLTSAVLVDITYNNPVIHLHH